MKNDSKGGSVAHDCTRIWKTFSKLAESERRRSSRATVTPPG